MRVGLGLGLGLNATANRKAGEDDPYGPELVSNGTFDTDTTGWTPTNATLSVVAGAMRITNTAASVGRAQQGPIAVEPGATYRYSYDCAGGINCIFAIGTTSGTAGLVSRTENPGSYDGTFVASGTAIYVNPRNGAATAGTTRDFDNISIKKVL